MKQRLPKILLITSGLLFAASLTTIGSEIYYGIVKPVSAIIFVVGYIMTVLQREMALYDEQQSARYIGPKPQGKPGATLLPAKIKKTETAPVLAHAH